MGQILTSNILYSYVLVGLCETYRKRDYRVNTTGTPETKCTGVHRYPEVRLTSTDGETDLSSTELVPIGRETLLNLFRE